MKVYSHSAQGRLRLPWKGDNNKYLNLVINELKLKRFYVKVDRAHDKCTYDMHGTDVHNKEQYCAPILVLNVYCIIEK
jgi:hypothetical protein